MARGRAIARRSRARFIFVFPAKVLGHAHYLQLLRSPSPLEGRAIACAHMRFTTEGTEGT